MVLCLEQRLNRITLYTRNEHIVSEERHALHHQYINQLVTIVLLSLDLQFFLYYEDRRNVQNTMSFLPIVALYLFHDDLSYLLQDLLHKASLQLPQVGIHLYH